MQALFREWSESSVDGIGDGVWGVWALYENRAFEDPGVGVCAKAATEETMSQTLWPINE